MSSCERDDCSGGVKEGAFEKPGLSKAVLEPEASSVLGAANNYVLETTGHPLIVIASA